MMGERRVQQEALFYEFSLERHVPEKHLLRSIDRFVELDGSRPKAGARLPYSITSSARIRNDCGTVRPSAVAVLRLITSSNLVGCWTGRSAGFAPLRIFPA